MQETKKYEIKGMHCASCASIIEKILKKTEGVILAEANYGNESLKLAFDPAKTNLDTLSKKIEPLGYSIVKPAPKKEKLLGIKKQRNLLLSVVPIAVVSIVSMTWDILAQFKIVTEQSTVIASVFFYLLPIMSAYTLLVVGKPYLLGVYRFLRYGKANMDTLIGIGTSVAFVYSLIITIFAEQLRFMGTLHTYFDVTIVVITFIAFGKYLEARSKLKTGDAIEKLLNLQAKTALVIRDG